MPILKWDKPAKITTTEQWASHYGFDGGPVGGYVPNMSDADQISWKAKITGKKLGFPQVEIRKTTTRGSQVLIIVSLGKGYNYKFYKARTEYFGKTPADFSYPMSQEEIDKLDDRDSTRGINLHVATNGAIQMTFDELQEMNEAIEEAKMVLESLG